MIDELRAIKSGNAQLREFGATMAAVLVVMGDIALLRGRPFAPCLIVAAFAFLVSGLAWPRVLTPLQKAWMGFGVVAGFVVSRIVLFIIYFGVLTPIGLFIRIAGRDVLDERIDRAKESYWHARAQTVMPRERYEYRY